MSKSKAVAEKGHTYKFGSPLAGWPTFGPDGKIIRAHAPEVVVNVTYVEPCRSTLALAGHCVKDAPCENACRWGKP